MPSFLTSDLFSETLLKPFREDEANRLYIVSGYATPSMASYHLEQLRKITEDRPFCVDILIGMSVIEGIPRPQKEGFESLIREYTNLNCRYVVSNAPVHSKVYAWYKDSVPVCGFIGSANYTQTAFLGKRQREVLGKCDAGNCKDYFDQISVDAAEIDDYRVTSLVGDYLDIRRSRSQAEEILEILSEVEEEIIEVPRTATNTVTLSFLGRDGRLPTGNSGLNWGQRPGRTGNEAYIKIPATISREYFFPPRGQHFSVLTDDGKQLMCAALQEQSGVANQGKGIQTPTNNSLLGEYFRYRLGISEGERITEEHLVRYGRTDVTFIKIDDETYFMDFSPPSRE